MIPVRRCIPLCAGVLWAWTAAWGAVKISGRGLVVLSESEQAGRSVWKRLDTLQQLFPAAAPASSLPANIYLVRSRALFTQLRPSPIAAAFYLRSPEARVIVIPEGESQNGLIITHEFGHMLIDAALPTLPLWMDEGLAEVLATAKAEEGGRWRVGDPIPGHVQRLDQERWLSLRELYDVTRASPSYREQHRATRFYAQSWALAHFLLFDPRYTAAITQGVQMLVTPTTLLDSLTLREDELWNAVRAHLRVMSAQDLTRVQSRSVEPVVQRLSANQALIENIQMLIRLDLPSEAEKRLNGITTAQREDADVQAAMGMVALQQGRKDVAAKHFGSAVEMGTEDSAAYVQYAAMVREAGQAARALSLLERAASLDPGNAEAQYLLGTALQREQRWPESLKHLQRAAELFRNRTDVWQALAYAARDAGDERAAREAARRSLQVASSEQEVQAASALVRMLEGTVSKVPQPEGVGKTASMETIVGELHRIDCLGTEARLHVIREGRPILLRIARADRVLVNESAEETTALSCGEQSMRSVEVRFVKRADPSLNTVGDVREIRWVRVQ